MNASKRIRFQLGQRERFVKGLERSGQFIDEIRAILRKFKMPERLAYLPHVESSFNTKARSKAGASGIWQFMRSTGKRFLKINRYIDERNDPILSTVAAVKLLKSNYSALNSWPLAITAYNYGLAGIKRAVNNTGSNDIGVIIREHKRSSFQFASKNFYSCFLAASELAANSNKYFRGINYKPPLLRKTVELKQRMEPKLICKLLGISMKTFKQNNPSFKNSFYRRRKSVPKRYKIFIPDNMSASYAREVLTSVSFKTNKRIKTLKTAYYVKKGDNLGSIAKKMNISIGELVKYNHISAKRPIFPGQILIIPGKKPSTEKKVTNVKKIIKKKTIKSPPEKLIELVDNEIPVKLNDNYITTYEVMPGDNLKKIASSAGVTVEEIRIVNKFSPKDKVLPGQFILVPKKDKKLTVKSNMLKKPKTIVKKATAKIKINKTSTETKTKYKKYTIKKGDSFELISKKTGVSIDQLLLANNATKRTIIYPGKKLLLPYSDSLESIQVKQRKPKVLKLKKGKKHTTFQPPIKSQEIKIDRYYKVKKGDTLKSIARKTGINIDKIAKVNNLNKYKVYEGQVLRIPKKETP